MVGAEGTGLNRRVFLVAGEPSGDRLGASLMAGMSKLSSGTEFFGVGGPEMASRGLSSIFDFRQLAVMGIAEIIQHLPRLLKLVGQTAEAVLASGADALITIDSPDFCLRVARRVRSGGGEFPIIHYVSPSVWAWRPGRAARLAETVDHVLALLPFEPEFLDAHGVSSTFVGHPVVAEPKVDQERIAGIRRELNIGNDQPVLVALPGSRRSEIDILAPVFAEAIRRFGQRHPEYCIVVPAASGVAEALAGMLKDWPAGTRLLDPSGFAAVEAESRKRAVLQMADLALAASGTVVLELAQAATPMVAAYDMKWISRQVIGALLKVETVNLVNLVTGSSSIPEFLGKRCKPDLISRELVDLAADNDRRDRQQEAFRQALRELGQGLEDPGTRAARAVFDIIRKTPQERPQTPSEDHSD